MLILGRIWPAAWAWLRSVRGRLVATYLVAASVLALAGVALFTLTLTHGLRTNVDAGLQTRAATLGTDLGASGLTEAIDVAPSTGVSRHPFDELQSITAVYAPNGRRVDSQPAVLPDVLVSPARIKRAAAADYRYTAGYAGESFRILIKPAQRPDGLWHLVVGQNLGAVDEANNEVQRALIITVPVLLVLVAVGAWLLSGAALRPVARMSADAQALGEHDSYGRITEPPTRDSLNHLARTFNALLDRLHNSLDRQRNLVADAGHELRTPLAVLQAELETAVRPNRTRADLVDSINHARVEVNRLATLAEDLLLLAQADGGQPLIRLQLTDVGELLDEIERSSRNQAVDHQVSLTFERPSLLIADVDPVALRRVVDNLLANSLRHTPPGGTVTVQAAVVDQPPVLRIRVTDTGGGFPSAFLPHVFDRFGRADQARSRAAASAGSGLGLAIVETLVTAHGGTVTVSNTAGGSDRPVGALVDLRFPTRALDQDGGRE
ncbi:MAG: integral rane sensor signal transduction histidine kinase [Pseudonocardiales bacterium]|nr:integral rane sensor signal transduction histidine kinase [Pseudonocardiales bacterium]